jgi:hypothetical protein
LYRVLRRKERRNTMKVSTKIKAGRLSMNVNEVLVRDKGRPKRRKAQTKLKAGQEVPPSPFRLR